MKAPGLRGLLPLLALIFISYSSFGQVFLENFEGEANNATSGTAVGGTWTTTLPTGGAASFSRLNVGPPYNGIFRIDNTTNEGVWRSNAINIAALGEVALEVLMGGNNATAADYVRAYYVIDGGAEVMFAEVLGAAGTVVFTASSAVVSGGTLQIVIRGRDNSGGGGLMGFDDVTVTDIGVLYSRASSAWNVGTTWSTGGFAGASCACTPDADSRVIIGNGQTVTFTADGTAAGVEIQNTGTLQWTANNLDLTVARGGTVNIQNGGTLTRVATTLSTIQFVNYTYNVINAGTLNIGSLVYNGSGNSVLTNSGTLTLGTVVGLVINGGNGYTFTNSGTGTINFQDMDINMADITVNNSGTINQTGNFTDVDPGSAFNNLANGTWNFSGTVTSNVRLFANNNSNTFNYSGAGQNIITPQDAYSNLTLSGSGAKVAVANFSVRGNWTRSGTATFTNGGFRVTLDGSVAQSISAVGGETFGNLTINNSSAASPQITLNNPVTVSTNLTMLDGNIDLNGNTFTLTSSLVGALTHTMVSTAGWMYGGSLVRNYPTTAIAVGTIAGYYPLGGTSNSRPFFIGKSNTGGSNGSITISYTDATTATNVSFMDGAATIQRRHDSFWTVTRTVAAGTFDIRAGGTGFTVGNVNDTRITRQLDALNIGTSAAAGGTVADVRANRTGLTSAQLANNFYLASTNSAATPLPIELAWFRAQVEGDEVIATWKTAQEKNNHYFTVEKTSDFETFYDVGRIDGRGTSAEEASYSLVDDSPFIGRSYYRLRQTDFDGVFTVSNPVKIEYTGPSFPFLKAYPNPFSGQKFTLEVKGVKDLHSVPVNLYNQQGQKIMELLIDEDGPGVFRKEILFPENLPAGLYFLKAGKTLQLTAKVVVN